jgi:hypothetical protein
VCRDSNSPSYFSKLCEREKIDKLTLSTCTQTRAFFG